MNKPSSLLILLVGSLVALVDAPAGAQGRGGGFGLAERPVVEQFDRDDDGRLDRAERAEARAWLESQPVRGFGRGRGGRGGFGGGRGFAAASPGRALSPDDVQQYPDESLYDLTTLRTIFLQFENDDWENELAAFNNTDVEVPATAIVDGQSYPEVGVHFRGASSFMFVPAGSKRSLNLAFDFVDDDQRLLDYRTLNLLNATSDPTFVRAMLYTHIAQQYLPTPKMNYVRVVINGESWGVYLNAQQFNRDFLRDWFGDTDGARWRIPGSPGGRGGLEYLGEDAEAYKGIYSIRTRDDEESWAALIELCRVLNETPAEGLEAALAPLLDIDGVLQFLALDVALANSDGYWTRASDYNLYRAPNGQFHVVPHDINEGLGIGAIPGGRGRGGRGGGAPSGGISALDPLVALDDTTKPLRSKLLAVPALRERYMAYVREIADLWLDWNTLEPLVRQYQALIADDVGLDTRKLYTTEAFTEDVDDALKRFADQRRAFLLGAP